ncbi:MAG TPA: DUF2934 domain-containing protein, partial [Candidatus Saccharimonadales bacterium]|nr:DUF2934 domain-containing protein [Candidatus Saccharimonadales bacterium]
GFVWGYALLWFLVNDRIKLLAYRIFDPVKAVVKPESKTGVDPKPAANGSPDLDAKAGRKPDAKTTDTKPEMKSIPETKPKAASDLTPQIAARAYELYERQGHHEGQSVQNWDKAEQEIRATQEKPKPNAETKPAAKAESAPETKAQSDPDASSKPAAGVKPKLDAKTETKPEPSAKPAVEVSPQLINRVHKLYEQLGREDVRAVQEAEEAETKK